MLRCLSLLSSGVPVKPISIALGSSFLHRPVKFTGLRTVAFINKDEEFSFHTKIFRQVLLNIRNVLVNIGSVSLSRPAELVDKRTY